MHHYRLLLALFALVAMLAMPVVAQAPQSAGTQVGGLSCQVDPSVGFIIVVTSRCGASSLPTQRRNARPTRVPSTPAGLERRHQRRWRVGLGCVRTDHWTASRSARWRVCRCFWRCWHWPGCRREHSPWCKFQPHHRASADFASRLDRIERGGRCVVAQAAPFAAVTCDMPTSPTNVRFRG